MSQTLKFLGRGSAFNKSEVNNCAYFKKGSVLVVIDCGNGVLNAIKRSGIMKGVKKVYQIVTHFHDDHVADLPAFFDYCNDELKIKPNLLNTISLEGGKAIKLGLKEGRDFNFVEPLSKNFKWVNVLLVPHAKNMDTIALEINFNNKKIFYSSDCSNIPFDIPNYDEYYLDCSESGNKLHMDINKVKEIIKKNKIKKQQVFLMHIESQRTLEIAREEGLKVVEPVVSPERNKIQNIKKELKVERSKEIKNTKDKEQGK